MNKNLIEPYLTFQINEYDRSSKLLCLDYFDKLFSDEFKRKFNYNRNN